MEHSILDHIGTWIKSFWTSTGGVLIEIGIATGLFVWLGTRGVTKINEWIDWRNRMILLRTLRIGIINQDICDAIRPERAIICRTHNGKGAPIPGMPIKVTIIDEKLGTCATVYNDIDYSKLSYSYNFGYGYGYRPGYGYGYGYAYGNGIGEGYYDEDHTEEKSNLGRFLPRK